MRRAYSEHIADLCYAIEDLFERLKAFNASFFEVTEGIYGIYVDDQTVDVRGLSVKAANIETKVETLSAKIDSVMRLPNPFGDEKEPPSTLNQALSIGHARMARRYIRLARVNAGMLHESLERYLLDTNKNALQKIRYYGEIYRRFVNAESYLCEAAFALRIAYNHAVSRFVVRQLIKNPLKVEDLKKGDIILSYKTSPYLKHYLLSRLIALGQKMNITHAALVYGVEGSRIRILAASGDAGRVGVFDLRPASGEYWFVFRPATTEHQYAELLNTIDEWGRAVSADPQRYQFAELKSWAALLLGYLLSEVVLYANVIVMVPNIFHSDRDYFCSEVIDRIFKRAGVHLVPRSRYDGVVGPAELFYSPYLQHVGIFVNAADLSSVGKEEWSI